MAHGNQRRIIKRIIWGLTQIICLILVTEI